MYHSGYGPSLSDMGIGPDDAHVGDCVACRSPIDQGGMNAGWGEYDNEGRLWCARCKAGDFGCAAGCLARGLPALGDVCEDCDAELTDEERDQLDRHAAMLRAARSAAVRGEGGANG